MKVKKQMLQWPIKRFKRGSYSILHMKKAIKECTDVNIIADVEFNVNK